MKNIIKILFLLWTALLFPAEGVMLEVQVLLFLPTLIFTILVLLIYIIKTVREFSK